MVMEIGLPESKSSTKISNFMPLLILNTSLFHKVGIKNWLPISTELGLLPLADWEFHWLGSHSLTNNGGKS